MNCKYVKMTRLISQIKKVATCRESKGEPQLKQVKYESMVEKIISIY